jgi:hypothetical protein
LSAAHDATPLSNEQAVLWHRSRQLAAAIRGLEEALNQGAGGASRPLQNDALAAIRKLRPWPTA